MHTKHVLFSLLLGGLLSGSAGAAFIASTNFDGRTASGNTATGLNWNIDGVTDPGTMSANQFEGGPINLFDSTGDVQDRFVPGINTGNGNTSWVTEISLTAAAGSVVTITDVTLDYVAINGGQAINVSRRSDFTVTVLSPADAVLAFASVEDASSGSNLDPVLAPVTLTLDNAVTLSDPGAYTLILRGGDFLGQDETGNHTGIDNLSINGTVAPIPEPTTLILSALAVLGLAGSRRRK